jgi:hypothetical protein
MTFVEFRDNVFLHMTNYLHIHFPSPFSNTSMIFSKSSRL